MTAHSKDDGMREALEPCPFCGCEAAVSAGSNYSGRDNFWIECAGCSAKSDTTDSLSEAIAAWNRRSSSAAASGVVEALEKALEEIAKPRPDISPSLRSAQRLLIARHALAALSSSRSAAGK